MRFAFAALRSRHRRPTLLAAKNPDGRCANRLAVASCGGIGPQAQPIRASRSADRPFPRQPTDAWPAGQRAFHQSVRHGLIIETWWADRHHRVRARPEGCARCYTIMFSTNSTHSANAYLYKHLGYDPPRLPTPLALLSRAPHAWCCADAPYPAFKDSSQPRRHSTSSTSLGQHRQPRGAHAHSYAGSRPGGLSRHAHGDRPARGRSIFLDDVSQTQEHIKAALRTLASPPPDGDLPRSPT